MVYELKRSLDHFLKRPSRISLEATVLSKRGGKTAGGGKTKIVDVSWMALQAQRLRHTLKKSRLKDNSRLT